ncbi:hypothetical protein Avbf_16147 [Armadillidium vulgare]|nr:hypothetical protein Avbf_16147 [Armadillidium vulgare]
MHERYLLPTSNNVNVNSVFPFDDLRRKYLGGKQEETTSRTTIVIIYGFKMCTFDECMKQAQTQN